MALKNYGISPAPLLWAQSQSMRCFTTKPSVMKPSTTSIGLVVTFTRLMPVVQVLFKFILFFDLQSEDCIKVS
jgi:hypothetical protein